MTEPLKPGLERPPCLIRDCRGRRLDGTDRCLAHAGMDDRAAALQCIASGDPIYLASGVAFNDELLRELLDALPRDDSGNLVVYQADFRHAILPDIDLSGAHFQGGAEFDGAHFQGDAGFRRARFHGDANFHDAKFQADARFDDAQFLGDAWFSSSHFDGNATFEASKFVGLAGFILVVFGGNARFDRADFQRSARFGWVIVHGDAHFYRASFQQAREVGPLLVRKRLGLEGVVFDQQVQIEVAAGAVCLRRCRFPAGVQLRLRYATVDLQDANLAAPAILAGAPAFEAVDETVMPMARTWQRLPPGPRTQRWRPRLVSLERADVAGLRLAQVDLRACRFAGAHNLDRLRIEGAPLLARPPGRWRARRLTIAEEQQWRASRQSRTDRWYPTACQPPALRRAVAPAVVAPVQVAAVYRELRKGREDAKDEPGAADFYYGEMEMRRHSPASPAAERLILTVYWLVSGYGLRAWRALAALAVIVGLVGAGLSRVGFRHPHPSLGVSWLYALQATVSLEGKASQLLGQLTLPGEMLRLGLRLTGPVLLGLALLSVRNRVKR